MRPRTIGLLALVALLSTAPQAAEPRPSSDLLLPYFEVDLGSAGGKSTLFAVGNAADEPVTVRAQVATNWGIRIVQTKIELDAGEVRTVNLRDWLVRGELPDRVLGPDALAHLQAALTGQVSPKDSLYYGTQPDPFETDLAVGYVTLRVVGNPRHDALWGDYFWVNPDEDFAEGELLVNIDQATDCAGLCDLHRLRFLDGGGFDGGTQLIVWSPRVGTPSPDANALSVGTVLSSSAFHRESGETVEERDLDLLPVQVLDVRDLLLDETFGWADLGTEEDVYVGVRYSASQRFSVTLQSWCIPEEPCDDCGPKRARIDLEKLTDGDDADEPVGFAKQPAEEITWEFIVTNTGNVPLSDIRVTDDQEGEIACPQESLEAGESMTCAQAGQAPAASDIPAAGFFYANVGEVVGTPPTGAEVTDSDPSHYFVSAAPSIPLQIVIEKATNGEDADAAPGPELMAGDPVTWSYVVSNPNSERTLIDIQVGDDREGGVTCPKTTLAPGESMACTPKQGSAQVGQYRNLATVTGKDSESEATASDEDPSHYRGVEPPAEPPAIDVEKATNGVDADAAPGPELSDGANVTWSYLVTNTGPVALSNVTVQDDKEGAVSCPKASLGVGESMTCTLSGVAAVGQYANLATAEGTGPGGARAQDTDPSHYWVPEAEECGDCEGKVTRLALRYNGAACATVEAHATPDQRFADSTAFGPATVCPGQTFEVFGRPSSSGGFNGTLGTDLELFVDGSFHVSIHTSCSQEIGPGFVAGLFTVIEAESQEGGLLCPLE